MIATKRRIHENFDFTPNTLSPLGNGSVGGRNTVGADVRGDGDGHLRLRGGGYRGKRAESPVSDLTLPDASYAAPAVRCDGISDAEAATPLTEEPETPDGNPESLTELSEALEAPACAEESLPPSGMPSGRPQSVIDLPIIDCDTQIVRHET